MSKAVLAVDDEPYWRELLRDMFVGLGVEGSVVESVAAALACARAQHFDLLVSDWRLYGGTAEALVADFLKRGRPVIVVSGDPTSVRERFGDRVLVVEKGRTVREDLTAAITKQLVDT